LVRIISAAFAAILGCAITPVSLISSSVPVSAYNAALKQTVRSEKAPNAVSKQKIKVTSRYGQRVRSGKARAAAVTSRFSEPAAKVSVKGRMVGMASYYRHGKRTANGERFNPNGLTAAHRTLPFGTKVRVTNSKSGRSVVVRINDRGPFIHGRIIDLAMGAARAIGMASTSQVELVVLN
jgi:rare lipoprotein A